MPRLDLADLDSLRDLIDDIVTQRNLLHQLDSVIERGEDIDDNEPVDFSECEVMRDFPRGAPCDEMLAVAHIRRGKKIRELADLLTRLRTEYGLTVDE